MTTTSTKWGEQPPLTLDRLNTMIASIPPAPPPMEFWVRTAAEQKRTACDVPLAWVRPRVPSKLAGRRGTRRAWKRRNPPHQTFTYREPDNILVIDGSALRVSFGRAHAKGPDIAIVTPAQMTAITAATGVPREDGVLAAQLAKGRSR